MSTSIVFVHVSSWPLVRQRHKQSDAGRSMSMISLPSQRLAASPNQLRLFNTSCACILVRRRQRSSTDGAQSLRLTCRMRWMLSLSKNRQHHFVSCSYWLRLATVEQNRARHCLEHPTLCMRQYFRSRPKTRLLTRKCGTGKINPVSDLFGSLAVGDEYRAEVLEFVNTLQGLTIRHDGLALLTRNECRYFLCLRSVNVYADCGDEAITSFKQTSACPRSCCS